jgi:hypothetical protein
MGRFEVPPQTAALVRERFQNTCVICGTADFTDVAHLYEDATEVVATSDRLVVLCPNHNQAQQRAHGKSAPVLPQEMQPATLLSRARNDYWQGSYRQGYGKARIAAYLYENQEAYSEAVDCLTESISAARPLRWGDWLCATMRESERLCILYSIGIARRWLFLDRVALVLFDYTRWALAAEVMSAAVRLRDMVTVDWYDPQRLTFDKQSALRRESLIRGSTRSFKPGESVPDLLRQLEEEAAEFRRTGKFNAFVTHLDVARNLAAASGDLERAHGYSEEVLDVKSKTQHKWALLEHLVAEAEYFAYRRDHGRSLYYAGEAMTLYSKHPAVLEPILQDAPTAVGIHDRIRRLGITEKDLLAHQVPIAPSINEVPLALDDGAVKYLVRNIQNV